MHTSSRLAPVRQVGTAASALIIGVCAANTYATWTAWQAHSVVVDLLDDTPGVTEADLHAADDMITSAFWVGILALVAAGAVFLTWLWRARLNAEHLNSSVQRMSRGWTIGSWFCPIVNLWFPRRILDDIWSGSLPNAPADALGQDDLPLSRVIRVWWLLMLTNVVLSVLARLQTVGVIQLDELPDRLETIAVYSTITTVIAIGMAAAVIVVIRQISGWQSARSVGEETDTP